MVFLLWYDRYDRTSHRTMIYFHRTKRPSYHPLQAIITLDGERISAQNRGSFESSRRALSNGKNRGFWLVDARKLWPVLGDSIIPTNNRLVPEKYEPVCQAKASSYHGSVLSYHPSYHIKEPLKIIVPNCIVPWQKRKTKTCRLGASCEVIMDRSFVNSRELVRIVV